MAKKRIKQLALAFMLVLAMTITSTTEGKADTKTSVKEIEVADCYEAVYFQEGMSMTLFKGAYPGRQCCLLNKNGKEITMGKYYHCIWNFSDGMAKVEKNGKKGYVDKNGKEIVKPKYDKAYDFSGGMAMVSKNGEYGFVNKSGKEIVKCKYDVAYGPFDGTVLVCRNDKWSYVNKNGKAISMSKYELEKKFKRIV